MSAIMAMRALRLAQTIAPTCHAVCSRALESCDARISLGAAVLGLALQHGWMALALHAFLRLQSGLPRRRVPTYVAGICRDWMVGYRLRASHGRSPQAGRRIGAVLYGSP